MSETSPPWALTVRASTRDGYTIADALGFDEVTEALAVSVFEDGVDHLSIQSIYETREQAMTARRSLVSEVEAAVAQLPDEDWVGLSQQGLPPIIAGRFAVHGSHDAAPTGIDHPIQLDAGQAFGTGHHGTTMGCLLMLDALEADGAHPSTILDLGTGAGVLAIAAAKIFPEADIVATDIDPVAVDVAKANARLNDVSYEAVVADGFDSKALKDRRFDLVIANILAGPLRGLAPDIARATSDGGTIILSGILDEQAEWVADAFRDQELRVEPRPSLDGWTSLLAHK